MRTTVSLDPDVLAGAEALRRQQQVSLSQAVNLLGAWVSTLRESCWGPGGRAGGCPGAVWRSGAG